MAGHTGHQAQSHGKASDEAQYQKVLLEPLRAVQSPRHDDFEAPSPLSLSRKQPRLTNPSTDSNLVGSQDSVIETNSQINDDLATTAPKKISGSYQQNSARVNDVAEMNEVIWSLPKYDDLLY